MQHFVWSDWYPDWGWFLWLGILVLLFSNLGNWRYTYSAHRKFGLPVQKGALDILNERYASGEITRDEFNRIKVDIAEVI